MSSKRTGNVESLRLADLQRYGVLDTDPEQQYDDLTLIASQICGTPIALVSFVDEHRQWFKAKTGLSASETPRDIAFCSQAIEAPCDVLEVTDATLDPRFRANPLVTGEPHVVFYAGAPLVNSNGSALGTLCVIDTQPRKLTDAQLGALKALSRQVVALLEQRFLSAELTRSNQDLSDFAVVASHDLRAPLRGIANLAGFVLEDVGSQLPEKSTQHLRTICARASRLSSMLNSLLAYARIGGLEQDLVIVDSRAALHDAARIALPDERFTLELPAELPQIFAPRAAVDLVFRNLLGNAVKHHDRDAGHLVIRSENADQRISISLEDDGPGIPADEWDAIFEPFKTLQAQDVRDSCGMGLALVRRAMDASRGEIAIEANGSNRGTRFTTTWLKP